LSISDAIHEQNLWAIYIQDQFKLSRAFTLTAGLRYDKHPLTGSNRSPRGSIVYSPWAGHAFRVSAGKAFRNPPLMYSYASQVSYQTSVPLLPEPVDVKIGGTEDLAPEWMTSFELGYQGTFGVRLRGGIDLFYNKLEGLTTVSTTETYAENALFPGSPGGIIPSEISVINDLDAEAYGGEVFADFSVTRWLSAYGNYSYQKIIDSKTEEEIRSAPRHKINSGLRLGMGKNFLISVFANYVDKTLWENMELDPYMMLNSMISYKMGAVEARLSVSNILNDRHLEHPQGGEIGRFMVLSLTYHIY
jgi:outer membrane receptor protein involved in Fe transport